MSRIPGKGNAVNKAEVEARFGGKNLTIVGGIGLFHRFVRKLGVEEALEQGVDLSRREGKYKTGSLWGRTYFSLLSLQPHTGRLPQ